MKKHLTRLSYILTAASLALPLLANAELPPGQAVTLEEVDSIINTIARFLIATSAGLAVIFIVVSGIMVMSSRDNPQRFQKGLLMLRNAIIGTAVVLGVGVIINTIGALVTRSFFCQLSVLGVCLY